MSIKIAVACKGHKGAVDLRDSQYPEGPGDNGDGEVLHFSPAEWTEFLAAVKAGKFDEVGKPDQPLTDR